MKNIMLISLILALSNQTGWSSTNPECLISNEYIDVLAVNSPDIFKTAEYNFEEDILVFNTFNTIASIQIYTAEDFLEFQLPVRSRQVKLDKNLY